MGLTVRCSAILMESKNCIYRLRTDAKQNIYTVDTKFITRKHDKDMNFCWEFKHKKDEHNFCNVPASFFIKENLDLLIYKEGDRQGNYIGSRFRFRHSLHRRCLITPWPETPTRSIKRGIIIITAEKDCITKPRNGFTWPPNRETPTP